MEDFCRSFIAFDNTAIVERVIIAKIVNANADESILTNGKVDYKKLQPIAFDPVSNKYVVLGEEVAQAFKEGLKLK